MKISRQWRQLLQRRLFHETTLVQSKTFPRIKTRSSRTKRPCSLSHYHSNQWKLEPSSCEYPSATKITLLALSQTMMPLPGQFIKKKFQADVDHRLRYQSHFIPLSSAVRGDSFIPPIVHVGRRILISKQRHP